MINISIVCAILFNNTKRAAKSILKFHTYIRISRSSEIKFISQIMSNNCLIVRKWKGYRKIRKVSEALCNNPILRTLLNWIVSYCIVEICIVHLRLFVYFIFFPLPRILIYIILAKSFCKTIFSHYLDFVRIFQSAIFELTKLV